MGGRGQAGASKPEKGLINSEAWGGCDARGTRRATRCLPPRLCFCSCSSDPPPARGSASELKKAMRAMNRGQGVMAGTGLQNGSFLGEQGMTFCLGRER